MCLTCIILKFQGNFEDMIRLTQWNDDRVLYFGDHPYADLADLNLNHGWRTGAIIQVQRI